MKDGSAIGYFKRLMLIHMEQRVTYQANEEKTLCFASLAIAAVGK